MRTTIDITVNLAYTVGHGPIRDIDTATKYALTLFKLSPSRTAVRIVHPQKLAPVAQSGLERSPYKREVVGSNPYQGSTSESPAEWSASGPENRRHRKVWGSIPRLSAKITGWLLEWE
mgnify:CR=1 FL=1